MLHTSHRRGAVILGPFTLTPEDADEIADRLKQHAEDARHYHEEACAGGRHLGPMREGAGRAFRVCGRCGDPVDLED